MVHKNLFAYCAFFVLIICAMSWGCKSAHRLPKVVYHQYEFGKFLTNKNDTLIVSLINPLNSPLRVWFFSLDPEVQMKFDEVVPVTLPALSDTILVFRDVETEIELISFASRLGDTSKKIEKIILEWPFPKNREYTVLQENDTDFTHNTDWSRYALDLDLKTNDTICSASDGFVVGVVDQYKHAGAGNEWRPYANFLTIYEPHAGVFLQYSNLVQYGSLVKIGDHVKRGQKIALSGNTGLSNIEHLHFSCLVPVNSDEGLHSIPMEFVGGIEAIKLKKGDKLQN